MKNRKHLVQRLTIICLAIILSSCETADITEENSSILENQKVNLRDRYDEYTIERPRTDGMHLVAKNEKTGSQLSVQLKDAFITGFQIIERDGNRIDFDKLVIPTAQNLPNWIPDCPDGWDEKLICYINKDGIAVSYIRCTPTSFTIGLEPEW